MKNWHMSHYHPQFPIFLVIFPWHMGPHNRLLTWDPYPISSGHFCTNNALGSGTFNSFVIRFNTRGISGVQGYDELYKD